MFCVRENEERVSSVGHFCSQCSQVIVKLKDSDFGLSLAKDYPFS